MFSDNHGIRLKPGQQAAFIVALANLEAEINRRGGVPYGWMRIYETLLCALHIEYQFPSHQAIETGCSVSTVQRALKWASQNDL
jgi:hypothetical protein